MCVLFLWWSREEEIFIWASQREWRALKFPRPTSVCSCTLNTYAHLLTAHNLPSERSNAPKNFKQHPQAGRTPACLRTRTASAWPSFKVHLRRKRGQTVHFLFFGVVFFNTSCLLKTIQNIPLLRPSANAIFAGEWFRSSQVNCQLRLCLGL